MIPYLIAGAIGFVVAKLFEEDESPKYDDGGLMLEEYNLFHYPKKLVLPKESSIYTPNFIKLVAKICESPAYKNYTNSSRHNIIF